VIEGDQEDNQSHIVISSENELQGNYKLVMVTTGNDSNTEYMFSQSGRFILQTTGNDSNTEYVFPQSCMLILETAGNDSNTEYMFSQSSRLMEPMILLLPLKPFVNDDFNFLGKKS
jgi:hypothetical protein